MTTDTSNATIARLVDEVNDVIPECSLDSMDVLVRACRTLEQLAREREADRKDAARYRTIRYVGFQIDGNKYYFRDRLDRWCDNHPTPIEYDERTTDLPQQAAQSGEGES